MPNARPILCPIRTLLAQPWNRPALRPICAILTGDGLWIGRSTFTACSQAPFGSVPVGARHSRPHRYRSWHFHPNPRPTLVPPCHCPRPLACWTDYAATDAAAMREDAIDYHSYQFDLFRDGLGWHAFIYPPGGAVPLCDVPVQSREDGRPLVVRAAKGIVRRHRFTGPIRHAIPHPTTSPGRRRPANDGHHRAWDVAIPRKTPDLRR
jgi:hypothetical protein